MSADNYYLIRRDGKRYAVSNLSESARCEGQAPSPIHESDPRFDTLDEAETYASSEYSEYGFEFEPGLEPNQMADHPLNDAMWYAFISWAFDHPEIRERFTKETGRQFLAPAKNPLEAMIDDATGASKLIAKEFAVWATRELWGMEYAPAKLREELEQECK